MGRPFYPHEADDPDLDWLVSNFLFERPSFMPIESASLPLVLLPYQEGSSVETFVDTPPPPHVLTEDTDGEKVAEK